VHYSRFFSAIPMSATFTRINNVWASLLKVTFESDESVIIAAMNVLRIANLKDEGSRMELGM
jgi:hypothetical protein